MELTLLILSYVGITLIILLVISLLKYWKWNKCLKLAKKMEQERGTYNYRTKKAFYFFKSGMKKPEEELYSYHEPQTVLKKIKMYRNMLIIVGVLLIILMIICTSFEYI